MKNRFDDFDSFNLESLWSHEVYIPQEPVCYKLELIIVTLITLLTVFIVSFSFIEYVGRNNNFLFMCN